MQNLSSKHAIVLASVIKTHYWYVAQLPKPQESSFAPQYCNEIGGKGLNVACALKQLGHTPHPIIGLGEDNIAPQVIQILEQHQITTQSIQTFAKHCTGTGTNIVSHNGQNISTVHLGANLLINSKHVEDAVVSIDAPQLIYAQFETSVSAIETAFKLVAKSCIKVLNPSPWQEPSTILKLKTQVLIVNEHEFASTLHQSISFSHCLDINGIQDLPILFLSKLKDFFEEWKSLQIIVVTLNQNGAVVFERTKDRKIILYYQAGHIVDTIDNTGCGDAFCAAFCASLLQHDRVNTEQSKLDRRMDVDTTRCHL